MNADHLEFDRASHAGAPPNERPWFACGYDLRGLGDGPRCPECGLLNVAERFREQVRAKLDGWTLFYSNPFAPWRKRLPGWFWSLDRPGDLRRCGIYAFIMLVLAAAVAAAGGYAAYSVGIVREYDQTRFPIQARGGSRPGSDPLRQRTASKTPTVYWVFRYRERFGVFIREGYEVKMPSGRSFENTIPARSGLRALGTELEWWPVKTWWILAVAVVCISILAWALPAFVGVLTQVRKLMPGYEKPVRSTLAALLLEAHRVPIVVCYLLLIYAASLGVAYWQHLTLPPGLMTVPLMTPRFVSAFTALAMLAVLAASLGWIGVLRSDPTHQLIRNRKHALRFFVMYCLVLLPIFYFTMFLAISVVYRRS